MRKVLFTLLLAALLLGMAGSAFAHPYYYSPCPPPPPAYEARVVYSAPRVVYDAPRIVYDAPRLVYDAPRVVYTPVPPPPPPPPPVVRYYKVPVLVYPQPYYYPCY